MRDDEQGCLAFTLGKSCNAIVNSQSPAKAIDMRS